MKKLIPILLIVFSNFLFSQSDCVSALPVCGNSNISYNPSSAGTVSEDVNLSCLSVEHYSVWYTFTIQNSGVLEFTINPNTVPNVSHYDYDFAVYGPNINCATADFNNPIRCNYSGVSGATGLGNGATDPNGYNNPVGVGSQWSSALPVLAGETYYLLIDNYIPSNPYGFQLQWGGTATLTSPFNSTMQPYPFIEPGPNHDGNITICAAPTQYDFTTLSSGILNNNPNMSITYHTSSNDALMGTNPITTATVNLTSTYYYSILYTDPTNPTNPINNCRHTGEIHFIQGAITVNPATISACNNNNQGTGLFNLTTASTTMFPDPTATRKYYPTLADMNAGTNEITNPAAFTSIAPRQIYVKITTTQNCTASGIINLTFFPVVTAQDAAISSCFIEANHSTATFNLTEAVVSTVPGTTKKYYTTQQDAINDTNAISNFNNFISPATTVYVRVTGANNCWTIAKITLTVIPPTYSQVLKDKTICIEDTTTLDAGPGFSAYTWSTGATTQSISNVSVGEYWVDLLTETCVTRQKVKVIKSQDPVVTNIDITNTTVTVTVAGGAPPYKYSLDGITWQNSNILTGVRGQNFVYVKDAFDCDPVITEITVPNLVNAITPNGDNVNDYVDYSALGYKKDLIFNIYDRYGNKLQQADKTNGYKWDGRTAGKKVITGTYWYSVTWTEPATNVPVKYTGWIMVKNRD